MRAAGPVASSNAAMQAPTAVESLDKEQPDCLSVAAEVVDSLKDHKCALLALNDHSNFLLDTAQAVLKPISEGFSAIPEASDQRLIGLFKRSPHSFDFVPSHLHGLTPGSFVSLLSQAFHFLHNTAVKFLEAIATPSRLDVQAFPRLHNDPLLQPERSCACALSIIQTCDPSQAQSFKSHKAEGLLTLIFIDQPAGLQVCQPYACGKNLIIPAGHVAVLPGYALQQATCGFFQAAQYRLSLGLANEQCCALTFELRASPHAPLNFCPARHPSLQAPLPPRQLQWSCIKHAGSVECLLTENEACFHTKKPDGMMSRTPDVQTPNHNRMFRDQACQLGKIAQSVDSEDPQDKFGKGPETPDQSEAMIGVGIDTEDTVMFENTSEEWSIAVLVPWGGLQTLTVCTDWKVQQMKELMQTLTGVCWQDQQLTHAGRDLPSHGSIGGSGLYDGCKVNLVIPSCKSHPSLVQLFIKPLNGVCHPVWVSTKQTVQQLKELLHLLLGPLPQNQKLIFAGRKLESEYQLRDYGLKQGFTLYLSIKRGPSTLCRNV